MEETCEETMIERGMKQFTAVRVPPSNRRHKVRDGKCARQTFM